MEENLLNYFPQNIQRKILGQVENFDKLEEIRLRVCKPIILSYTDYERIIEYNITYREIIEILRKNLRKFYIFISKPNL